MPVVVSLPLFGSPDRELEEKASVTGADLRRLGTELKERLQQAAEMLDKLRSAGWTVETATFDLLLEHPDVQTKDEAVRRLQSLGIDIDQLLIIEDVDDEEM